MKKINEIFYSLQGEGFHSGTPAVFVRFSRCNLQCPFCDTQHTDGTFMSNQDIAAQVARFSANLVVLTGGEPSLYVDTDLCNRIHQLGKTIAMETNGTRIPPREVDFITLSPKFEFTPHATLAYATCDELKVVWTGNNDMSLYDNIHATHRYLQPCDTGNHDQNRQIIRQVVEYCLANPQWSISLQLHKILDIR